VLDYLHEHGPTQSDTLAELVNLSTRSLHSRISRFVNSGAIVRPLPQLYAIPGDPRLEPLLAAGQTQSDRILAALTGEPLTTAAIAVAAGVPGGRVSDILTTLVRRDRVAKVGHGLYTKKT
jgi:predicted Rossmann fold nucleotide-binding protein DprA/Smf involved in DNA uptake